MESVLSVQGQLSYEVFVVLKNNQNYCQMLDTL